MTHNWIQSLFVFFILLMLSIGDAKEPIRISGVYPHLTMRNNEGECGTGAVVLWQGSLWAITYAPHRPNGSSDKLYEIKPDLSQNIFEGSVGGTPANRMIHSESNQLLIGPYLIDAEKKIRVIPPSLMYGRLTGNARHLNDPSNKVYYATMEEGLYEVDLKTLDVNCLIRDGNSGAPKVGIVSKLPGYHGKGLYSSQGRVIYANNGEHHQDVKTDPTIASGALAQWLGKDDWQLVRRNQFTEVTGPGGITGNPSPDSDPIWAMGWDAKSVILALLENKEWSYYRLPKASHSYDGSHGWNTEWPRIREIGEKDFLATMHGTFWKFPANFSRKNSSGISPRSNYLKVIGDFCRWNDDVVLGCDDSAKSEFLNVRSFKAKHAAAQQSNSNLWFLQPSELDHLGPEIGRGSVWLRDDVSSDVKSDPFLFSGYDYRQLHLFHQSEQDVSFLLEVDEDGTNEWKLLREVNVAPGKAVSLIFNQEEQGAWIRLLCKQQASSVTANFQYRNKDQRTDEANSMFTGIATTEQPAETIGLMRSLSFDRLGVVVAPTSSPKDTSFYVLNQQMELIPQNDSVAAGELVAKVLQPANAVTIDDASVLIIEDGKRYRLPKSNHFSSQVEKTSQQTQGKQLKDFMSENIAIGAKASASSTHLNYAASKAVDGSLSEDNRWIGNGNGTGVGNGETWIELDLGKAKTFRSLWVISGWKESVDYVLPNFDIQMKHGDEWETISGGAIRQNHKVQTEIVFEKPITAQHIRLTTATSGFVRIYEIALFDRKLAITPQNAIGLGLPRICREVATERDLLNVRGTFYELPARNAQGIAKIRPIATHNLTVHDFCSHSGLLFFTGIDAKTTSEHIIRSEDGNAAVWAGVVDDLWKLGKPRGIGGPWNESKVIANQPSDPYLMTAYDQKRVTLSSSEATTLHLQVDVDGTNLWIPYQSFQLQAGEKIIHHFPEGFSAYWVRAISSHNSTATVLFEYK